MKMTAIVADLGRLLLAFAGIAAMAGLAAAPRSRAQSQEPPLKRPEFDVAVVKPMEVMVVIPGQGGVFRVGITADYPHGTFTCTYCNLKFLLAYAYSVKNSQIAGPDWIDRQPYSIDARMPPGSTQGEVLQMLQALLAERFHLTLHREQRLLPVYALVAAKNGPKLRGADEVDRAASFNKQGTGYYASNKGTIEGLAGVLSRYLGRPVLDMTGLKGSYDISLKWAPDENLAPDDASLSSVFSAVQEQLGLRLESRKAPVDFLVVDRVDKTPTEN